jgi:DNA-binding NtrC family response regulator
LQLNNGGEFLMVTAPDSEWVRLHGKTLAEIIDATLRAAFARHHGDLRAMMRELGVSKASLQRKLEKLGLRGKRPWLSRQPERVSRSPR